MPILASNIWKGDNPDIFNYSPQQNNIEHYHRSIKPFKFLISLEGMEGTVLCPFREKLSYIRIYFILLADEEAISERSNQLSLKNSQIKKIFSEKGLRATHQRLEIYKELLSCKDHPSAETLYQRVKENLPITTLETVYRSLHDFELSGLVVKISTNNRKGRFDGNVAPHHHIICTKCDKISDFQSDFVDLNKIEPEINDWGVVESINMVLYGVCRECLKSNIKLSNRTIYTRN